MKTTGLASTFRASTASQLLSSKGQASSTSLVSKLPPFLFRNLAPRFSQLTLPPELFPELLTSAFGYASLLSFAMRWRLTKTTGIISHVSSTRCESFPIPKDPENSSLISFMAMFHSWNLIQQDTAGPKAYLSCNILRERPVAGSGT
jgi:hypothetical protein